MYVLLRDDCKLMLLLPPPPPPPRPPLAGFHFSQSPLRHSVCRTKHSRARNTSKNREKRHISTFMQLIRAYMGLLVLSYFAYAQVFRINVPHGHSRKHTYTHSYSQRDAFYARTHIHIIKAEVTASAESVYVPLCCFFCGKCDNQNDKSRYRETNDFRNNNENERKKLFSSHMCRINGSCFFFHR